MNRRALLASLAAISALSTRHALADPAARVHRLGLFFAGWSENDPEPKIGERVREFRANILKLLADVGYREGVNLAVTWRFFAMKEFSQAPRLAVELVRSGVDAIWTAGTPQTRAIQDATETTPIVTSLADPVAAGFTRSLARPSGNVTGFAGNHPDMPAKQIELFRRVVRKLDRIVFIGDARYQGARERLAPLAAAASKAGLRAEVRVVEPSELDRTFREMRRTGARAAYLEFTNREGEPAIALAIEHGVATMMGSGYVERGALFSYDMYHADFIRGSAVIVGKLFKGIKIADIPWELPDRSRFAVNLRTAKSLGLQIPSDLLLSADQVIE